MDLPQDYFDRLKEFIAFKSISTDPQYLPEISKTVDWLKNLFEGNSFKVDTLQGSTTNPVVLARLKTEDSRLKTILIYGHYDVQPAPPEGWNSDPFTLTEKEGRLWGRGVVDNKGQTFVHIYTVLELIKSGQLKYNVKFLLEGNEETSNPDLAKLLEDNKDLFACDYVLVSDGEIVGDTPTIETSLRGGFNLTLTYQTAANNVHSGLYGGAIPNATHELTKLLSQLYTADNTLTIPNFYDTVDPITEPPSPLDPKSLLDHIQVTQLMTEPNLDFFTQTGLRPTIQITGFKSGYIDTGYSNIVPATAEARLNFRLVTSQTTTQTIEAFKTWVANHTPKYVKYEISVSGEHEPIKVNTDSHMIKDIAKLLETSFGKSPIFKHVGGAIPFVGDVKAILGKDTLLVSLGNDDCNMHGANENYSTDLLLKGLKFSQSFFLGLT